MSETIIITALICLSFHVFTWPGMVFHFVDDALKDLPEYLKKPLYSCPTCSTVWWSPSIVAVGMLGNVWQVVNFWQLFIIMASASALNTIFGYIIGSGKAIIKHLKEDDCCGGKEKPGKEEIAARRKRLLQFQLKNL